MSSYPPETSRRLSRTFQQTNDTFGQDRPGAWPSRRADKYARSGPAGPLSDDSVGQPGAVSLMFLKNQNGDRIMRQVPASGRKGDEMPSLLRHVIDLLFDIRAIARRSHDFVFIGW